MNINISNITNWRYSTKRFDTAKRISPEVFDQIKNLLQMSPSSTNLQPWHFIVASTDAGKQRVAKGAQGFFKFNESKILSASHVIVFCARTTVDEVFMKHLSEQEDKDGRYPNSEVKQNVYNARNMFADIHRYDLKDLPHWIEKQVYLNVGNLLLGAAILEVDALPMEGIDVKEIDSEFDLRAKGFTAVCVVALGYRDLSDFNITDKTPKSRLPLEEIITELD